MKCDGCRKKVKKLYNPVVKYGYVARPDRMRRVCKDCKPRVGLNNERIIGWVEPHETYAPPSHGTF